MELLLDWVIAAMLAAMNAFAYFIFIKENKNYWWMMFVAGYFTAIAETFLKRHIWG